MVKRGGLVQLLRQRVLVPVLVVPWELALEVAEEPLDARVVEPVAAARQALDHPVLPEEGPIAPGGVRDPWVAGQEQAGSAAFPPRGRDRREDDPRIGGRAARIRHALLVEEIPPHRQGVGAATPRRIGDIRNPLRVGRVGPQRAVEPVGGHRVHGGPEPPGGMAPADDRWEAQRSTEPIDPLRVDPPPVGPPEEGRPPPGAVEAPPACGLPLPNLDPGRVMGGRLGMLPAGEAPPGHPRDRDSEPKGERSPPWRDDRRAVPWSPSPLSRAPTFFR